MFDAANFEHYETAYGQNIRGFPAFVPDAFGCNPVVMGQYYNEIYVYGPDLRFPVSHATIAGAAAYKAVQELPKIQPYNNHAQAISNVRAIAARETQILLQRYPLPDVDPEMIILSAEEGAHRLYVHVTNVD